MENEGISALPPPHCCNDGQCAGCGAWFPDWDGGICSACQANGY